VIPVADFEGPVMPGTLFMTALLHRKIAVCIPAVSLTL
jgi:hypothetical protein